MDTDCVSVHFVEEGLAQSTEVKASELRCVSFSICHV